MRSTSLIVIIDPDAPPLLLAHGGFDFGRTFDVFAPLLAGGGWRVISWDQRGHGDSDHPVLYSWQADVRDAAAVLDSVSHDPMPFVGHSKGGALSLRLAISWPHRCSHLVNMDGIPSDANAPDVADHQRTRLLDAELADWLDYRRATASKQRRPGTIAELAERRGLMNPRLPSDWLRYLVTVGGRRDRDGWRWKLDPALRFGGFGPWRPLWALEELPGLSVPLLGILGGQPEPMGWGTPPDLIRRYAPAGTRIERLDDVGHFVHIEAPERVANLVLEFLS